MRPSLKSALFFATSWIIIKLLLFQLNVLQEDIFWTGLINNFFLLAAIAVGLYFEKKREGFAQGSALSDIKNAMIAGAPYALIVSVFMFFYYNDINPEFIENREKERMDIVYQAMERDTYVDSLRQQNQDFNMLTKDEIYASIKEETASALSPKSLLTLSLLGLIVLGFTYSIFVMIIFRKVLLREHYNQRSDNS